LNQNEFVVLKGKYDGKNKEFIGINLLMNDGKCFTAKFKFQDDWQEIKIPLSEFTNGPALILPNSYPQFLPKIWKPDLDEANQKINLNLLQFLQITCDKPKSDNQNDKSEIAFRIESIMLECK